MKFPQLPLMKTTTKKILVIALASALTALLGSSCRTAQGFGRDVEHAGEHIEEAAR